MSPASSSSSMDEEDVNCRVSPHWPDYRNLLFSKGFRLDTVRDVKQYYRDHFADGVNRLPSSTRARLSHGDDALCPDAGLRDNLFRGTCIRSGTKVVIKAVHCRSRELEVIRFLSTSPIREHQMNHCIRAFKDPVLVPRLMQPAAVLDLVVVPDDDLAFIVMEEWSSQLIADGGPCCLRLFLGALRQCIEHAVFMHMHRIAHLDISLRNLVTDYNGRYACIDYELSRRLELGQRASIIGFRATEVPPECENGECRDPFKVDVWALAVLMLRACKMCGYCVPELLEIIKPMLNENPDDRPTALAVLKAFDRMIPLIGDHRLQVR
ncbi:kinase-like domain-containing protein [Armillaria borealis]|uniref:Kinase-like domain-containing protein n=1 Tax=Armillaria borealis TaxID=47425 RepID=A0AA39JXT7_9AGAR|nr:kinase-like domain-containing protein [Armillaria borealis]